jgi:hypothetical protein
MVNGSLNVLAAENETIDELLSNVIVGEERKPKHQRSPCRFRNSARFRSDSFSPRSFPATRRPGFKAFS